MRLIEVLGSLIRFDPAPLPAGMYEGVGWRTQRLLDNLPGHHQYEAPDRYAQYGWPGLRRKS